jgi:hypothetical protein
MGVTLPVYMPPEASPSPVSPDLTAGAPAPAPPATSTGSPPGRRPKKGVLMAIAAIVVVAVVVLALFMTGVLPGSGSSSNKSSGTNLPYSTARPLADAAAAGAPGAPWTSVGAKAVDVNAVMPLSTALFLITGSSPGNDLIWTHYLTSARPNIPAFSGSLSSGLSPWWLFEYSNGTTADGNPVVLLVVVVNGTATALATAVSNSIVVPTVPFPGHPTMDSPAVMALAVTENSSYVNAHPGLNATFSPVYEDSPGFAVGWIWTVEFSVCAPFGQILVSGTATYNGTSLAAEVNDTSGALLSGGFGPMNMLCSTAG